MKKLHGVSFVLLFFSVGLSDPPDWTVNYNDFQLNASMTGVLIFNGVESTDSADIIAAFVGDECRGVDTTGFYFPPTGRTVYGITLYANESGESFHFKAYDASMDHVFDSTGYSYSFVPNDIVGSAEDPVEWNFTSSLLGDPNFDATITAVADDVNYELTFGFSPDATDGYDEGFDQYAPPAPPPPAFDAALAWNGDRYYTQIVNGSEDDLVEHVWDIQIAYPPSNQVTLQWDSDFLMGLGTFILQDAFGGLMINVDMTQQSSLELTNPAFNTLKLLVTPSGESPPPEETEVTFTVVDEGNGYQDVELKGQMTDWVNVDMDHDGAGTWTLTLPLESGSYEWGAIENDGSEEGIWLPSLAGFDTNPTVIVGPDGTVSGDVGFTVPFQGGDDVTVTFQVDMSDEDVSADGVHIAGTMNNWTPTDSPMSDDDGDGVYDASFSLVVGSTAEYKFLNGNAWGTEESVPDECSLGGFGNRYVDVPDSDLVVEAVCFGSCEACADEPPPSPVNVTFQVNMAYQDPSNGVYIRGGNIGSSMPDVPSMGFQMSDDNGDLVYDVTLELDANSHYTYKFATGESWNWEGNWENVPAECGEGDYLDRFMDTGEEDMTLDPVCFGSCDDCETQTVDVTFNLDMSDVETSADGVFVGGGGTFGVPGDNPMSDDDGDDVWTLSFELPANLSTDYTFLNGNCGDWSCKEDIGGQDCAVPPYNDRHIDLGTEDVTVNACFAVCGDGFCDELVPPDFAEVTFQVDVSELDLENYVDNNGEAFYGVYATGSFDGWEGWGTQLYDDDGDGVYSGTREIGEGDWEYLFTVNGWNGLTGNAPLGSECDWNPDDEWANYGLTVGTEDIVLDVVCWQSCSECEGEPPPSSDPDFAVTMTAESAGVSYDLTFGFSPGATDGYDAGMDQYAPPAPPPPAFDAALAWNGERFYTQILNGSMDDLVEHEWDVQLQFPASNEIVLNWDTAELEGLGTFILQDAFGGAMVSVDMTVEGTLELTNPALNLLKLMVTPSGEGPPPPPPGDPEFVSLIGAFAGDVSYNMAFGFSPEATDGYDAGMDQYAPPAPPPPAFDAALGWNGERYYTQIVNGSVDDLVEHEWELQLQFPASNEITLVWDNVSSDLGTFYLQDAFGGAMINVDMTEENSFLVDNPAFTTLKILVTPSGSFQPPELTEVTFTVVDDGNGYEDVELKGQMTDWANVDMENDGTGTWTLTLDLESGSYEWGAVENDGSEWGIWLPELAGFISNPVVMVDSNGNISGDTGFTVPYQGGPGETVVVMFQVDMIEQDVSEDGVHIAGTFNNWNPEANEMQDDDNDGIYSLLFELETGSYHEYKFINGNSWGSEELVPAECNTGDYGNRFVQVLDMDMVLDAVCFGSCTSCEGEPPPGGDPDFAVTMTAESGGVSYDLTFGFSPEATDGYDAGVDQYAPPAPPPPSFDAALAWNSERFYTQIVNGSLDDLVEHVWDVQLQFPASYEIFLNWDSAGLEGLGTFILQDAFGGVMINVDMTMEGSLELTNPALNLLKIKVTPSGEGPPPPPSGDPEFIAQIGAFAEDLVYDMAFGFSPNATDGFDPGIDDFAPPAPPPPAFDAALGWEGERYYTSIVHGSANDLVEHEWEILLQFPVSGQITLVWDNAGWSGLGTFILQDPFGGDLINIDMTQQNSFLVDNTAFTVLKLLVTPSGGEEEFSGPHWHVSVDGSDETGNGSVQEPFATVQKAVDMAGVQDTIHVHPGTYYENIIIENKNLVINGQAGPSVTILDGNGGRVIEFHNVNQPAMLKSFTIQNGYSETNGGGILIADSHIRLIDLMVHDNYAFDDGGGIFSVQSTVILRNSLIENNSAGDDGGGLNFFSDDSTTDNFLNVDNTVFTNNACGDEGGGLRATGMSFNVMINVSKFIENSGVRNVGCRIYGEDVEFEILNCTIIGNQAQQYAAGGGFTGGASGILYKVNIVNNIANLDGSGGNSGGISVWSESEVGFVNCNFIDNQADYGSGLTVGGGGRAALVNSILWGNSNDQLAVTSWNDMGGNAIIFYSDLQGGEEGINVVDDLSTYVWGEENINLDPLFVGEGPNPHLLTENSPCVDAGTDFLMFEGDTLVNIPPEQYISSAPDMGAFESPFGVIGGDPDFTATINATGGTADYDLVLGFSPDATDGFDPGLDQYAPPAPPPPSFDAALGWNGERFYTQVVHGSANDLVEHEWEVQLQFSPSNEIILVWDNSGWDDLGTFHLQDAFGGTMINIDMTQENSFLVDNPAFTVLKFLVTPFGGEPGPEIPFGFEFYPTPFSAIVQGIATIDQAPASNGDWIAAFDEEGNCAGAQQLAVFDGQAYINLAVYGDDSLTPNIDEGMNAGEDFLLVLYDTSEDAYLIYPESFSGWFNNNGAPLPGFDDPSVVFNFQTAFTDEIEFMESWNLISFDIDIENNSPESVFQDLIVDNELIYVTGFDEGGSVFFDPNGLSFLNTLTELDPGAGYWVKVSEALLLEQEGFPIPADFSINLIPNWNLIGYWLHESMTTEDAFNELILSDNLIYVTGFTEVGAVFYDPTGLPFLNTLTELYNGYGYWVKVLEEVGDFTYPEPPGVLAKMVDIRKNTDIIPTNRFMFINGTVSFEDIEVTEESYVGVYTESGILIGEMKVLEDGYLQTGAIYGNDLTTQIIDGAEAGEILTFSYSEFESDPIIIRFSDNMELQKVDLTFRNIPDEFALMQNVPNPFNPVTSIHYKLPEQAHVLINVYDILGRKVRTLVNDMKDPGFYSVRWNGTTDTGKSVGSGVYIYEFSTPQFYSTRKMLIIK